MKLSRYIRENINNDREKVIESIRRDCGPWLKDPQVNKFLYRGNKRQITNIERVKTRLDDRMPKDTPASLHNELNLFFIRKFGWPVRNGVFTSGNINNLKHYHHHGDPDIFMPIGKFEFVWSPDVEDLYSDYFENDKLHTTEQLEDYYYGDFHDQTVEYYVDDKRVWNKYDLLNWFDAKDLSNINMDNSAEHKVANKENPELIHNFEIIKIDFEDFVRINFSDNNTPDEVVDLYIDRRLRDAIKSGNEICFKCDEYYLIERKFEEDLWEAFYA